VRLQGQRTAKGIYYNEWLKGLRENNQKHVEVYQMPTVGRQLARWRCIGESRQQQRAGVADAQNGEALEPPVMGLSFPL